jgi:hypothetical protein
LPLCLCANNIGLKILFGNNMKTPPPSLQVLPAAVGKARHPATSILRKITLTIISALALGILALLLWRSGSAYDPSKIDAHLRGMREPYQAVILSCCMCGDLSFRVVAGDGKTHRFAIVAQSRSESAPEGMLMWDAASAHDTNATAVAMNADTRRMLTGLVERHTPPGFIRDQGLVVLRGDPWDHVVAICHGLADRVKELVAK